MSKPSAKVQSPDARTTATTLFNTAQSALLNSYAGGEYEHFLEIDSQESLDVELQNCGDGLLRFLMVELSSQEDCDTPNEALSRVKTAIGDLESVRDEMQALVSAKGNRP